MIARPQLHVAAARLVAGVDEAGRGPLAGPVVAAAVILDDAAPIDGLADSKTLTAARRDELFEQILTCARSHAVGWADRAEIDRLNILEATMLAMRRAVLGLHLTPARISVLVSTGSADARSSAAMVSSTRSARRRSSPR